MSQSLSASAGAGSLLSIGAASVASAEASVQGALGENAQATQSFDKSMQQAGQQHLPAETKQSKGGYKLPEGGETLPSVDEQTADQAPSLGKGGSKSVSTIEAEAGEVVEHQHQQALLPTVGQDFQKNPAAGSAGYSALQQINKHRDVDLSVVADSVLKSTDTRGVDKVSFADSAGKNAGRLSAAAADVTLNRSGVADPLAQREVSVIEVAHAAVGAPHSQRVEFVERFVESGVDRAASGLLSDVAVGVKPGMPVSEASLTPSDTTVVSQLLSTPAGTAETDSIEGRKGQVATDSSVAANLLDVEKPVAVQKGALSSDSSLESVREGGNGQEPAKSLFAESIAQVVRDAGLASAQLTESAKPLTETISEAVSRLVVPAGLAAAPKVGAVSDVADGELFAKTDAGFVRAESQPRVPQAELVVQSPVRQTAESVAQAGSVLAGTQQAVGDLRRQVKTSGLEIDKLSGVEQAGRSEGRQEALLTSFADSLTAAGKVSRTTTEPMQLAVPHGVRPGMPSWGQAVNDRVMMMASKNGQFAEIQLDPPELGSLQVKLQVKNEQVSVVFNTPHGSVREALEQSMPRLREMFAEQGLNLAESSVHDQSEGRQRKDNDESESGGLYTGRPDDSGEELGSDLMQQESLSLVDYYA